MCTQKFFVPSLKVSVVVLIGFIVTGLGLQTVFASQLTAGGGDDGTKWVYCESGKDTSSHLTSHSDSGRWVIDTSSVSGKAMSSLNTSPCSVNQNSNNGNYDYSEPVAPTAPADTTETKVIKNEIEALMARIRALNEQIKTGVAPKSGVKEEKKEKVKKDDSIKPAPLCKAITTGLALGSRDNGKGGPVHTLQQILIAQGHLKGEATGYFGEQTRGAVQSFQRAQGIVSGGDERTTGFGRVGAVTHALFQKHCATAYTLDDVATVTKQSVDPIPNAADDEYTRYVITLKDKTVREVKHNGFNRSMTLEERVKQTGYSGDVAKLLAKATTITATKPEKPKRFSLGDIATVTAKEVDPKAGVADDEYTEYTITLKSGVVIEVKGHPGRGTESTRYKPFKDAGYTGSLSGILEKVTTPSVLGAATSSPEGLLLEIEEKLAALQLFFMKE